MNEQEIAFARELFQNIDNQNFPIDDPELMRAPSFEELEKKYGETDPTKLQEGFDEAYVRQKIQQLEAGEFNCKEVPEGFTDDVEASKVNSLFLWINEQKFTPSYNSPFEDFKSDKIHRVDATGQNGAFKSINAAIEESLPGDTIFIEKGVYNESVVITKPIELKAEGNTTIESNESDAILLNTSIARISGLTIKCRAPGNSFCIRIQNGFLEAQKCNIEAHCAAAIRADSNCRLMAQDCTVSVEAKNLTSFGPYSRIVFHHCIFRHDITPIADDNSKKNPKKSVCNLIIGEFATGIFIDCAYDNTVIIFQGDSFGMVKKGIIDGIKEAISIKGRAQVLILSLEFNRCEEHCIQLNPDSYAIIQDCVFRENPKVAVVSHGSPNFIITDCTFDHGHVGCRFYENAEGTITNTKFLNMNTAIQIESKCSMTIGHCTFSSCTKSALTVSHDVEGSNTTLKIYSSDFHDNYCSIAFIQGIVCHISACKFKSKSLDFKITGNNNIMVFDSEFGNKNNATRESFQLAIQVMNNSEILFNGCRFSENYKKAIIIEDDAKCTIINSQVFACDTAINASKNTKVVIEKSKVSTEHRGNAIDIQEDAELTIDNSDIHANAKCIILSKQAKATITKSRIYKISVGILMTGNSYCLLDDNTSLIQLQNSPQSQKEDEVVCGVHVKGNKDTQEYPRFCAKNAIFTNVGTITIMAENLPKECFNISKCLFQTTGQSRSISRYIKMVKVESAIIDQSTFTASDIAIDLENCGTQDSYIYFYACNLQHCKRSGIITHRSTFVVQLSFFSSIIMGIIANEYSVGNVENNTYSKIQQKFIEVSNSQITDNNNHLEVKHGFY